MTHTCSLFSQCCRTSSMSQHIKPTNGQRSSVDTPSATWRIQRLPGNHSHPSVYTPSHQSHPRISIDSLSHTHFLRQSIRSYIKQSRLTMGLEHHKESLLKPRCNPPRIAKDECNDLIASSSPTKKRKTSYEVTSPLVSVSMSQLDAAAAYRVDNAEKRATMVTAIRNLCKAYDATGGNSADILGMTEHEFLRLLL